MFERAPFQTCPHCGEANSLGILNAGGDSLTRRCRKCRYSLQEMLPEIDKAVIYLDQFAVSNLFKVKSGSLKPGAGHAGFWTELERVANRALLLQQVVFPISDVHSDETIVSKFSSDLRIAHEILGDISLMDVNDVEDMQILEFANAYQRGVPPQLNFDVDEILDDGNRNSWLPDLHVTTNFDFQSLANGIRDDRSRTAEGMEELAQRWAKNKPSFAEVLSHELNSFASANIDAILHAVNQMQQGIANDDWLQVIGGAEHKALRRVAWLREFF